jgi:hypothetical protein
MTASDETPIPGDDDAARLVLSQLIAEEVVTKRQARALVHPATRPVALAFARAFLVQAEVDADGATCNASWSHLSTTEQQACGARGLRLQYQHALLQCLWRLMLDLASHKDGEAEARCWRDARKLVEEHRRQAEAFAAECAERDRCLETQADACVALEEELRVLMQLHEDLERAATSARDRRDRDLERCLLAPPGLQRQVSFAPQHARVQPWGTHAKATAAV